MKRLLLFLMLSFATTFIFANEIMQDVVYLKDGGILRGTILEQVPNESLLIQLSDGNVFHYSMDKVAKITKEILPITSRRVEEMQATRSFRREPVLSCLLSVFVPGLGQVYNGQYTRGAIHFISSSVCSGIMFSCLYSYDNSYGSNEGLLIGATISAIGVLGIWLGSAIDAPISAVRVNRRNGYMGHLNLRPSVLNDYSLTNGSSTRIAPGLSLSYTF